jgi:hypothetical protein
MTKTTTTKNNNSMVVATTTTTTDGNKVVGTTSTTTDGECALVNSTLPPKDFSKDKTDLASAALRETYSRPAKKVLQRCCAGLPKEGLAIDIPTEAEFPNHVTQQTSYTIHHGRIFL